MKPTSELPPTLLFWIGVWWCNLGGYVLFPYILFI